VAGDGLKRDGLELLLALVRQSLVAVQGDGRYRLLDTIRAFAWERLTTDSEEMTAAQRRHAAWYADVLNDVAPAGSGHAVEGWRGELRGSMVDLRRAVTWCFSSGEDDLGARLLASLWWLWPREGIFEEAGEWFASAKAAIAADSRLGAALFASAGTFAVSRGDLPAAAEDCEVAATTYERFGDELGLARVLIAWGIALWGQGDYGKAGEVHDRAAALFAALGDGWGNALSLVLRARTALDAGDTDAGVRLRAAEGAARACGDQHVVAAALVQRATSDLRGSCYETAERFASESLRLNEQHGHREGAVGSLHVLGLAWLGQQQVEQAGGAFLRALTTALSMHHGGATAESLDGLAVIASRQRRWTDAARLLAAADRIRSRSGIRRSVLVGGLVTDLETALETALDGTQRRQARDEGQVVDLLHLAAEQQARLTP
jgi:tetratricopeptide (TPR) repeat protein